MAAFKSRERERSSGFRAPDSGNNSLAKAEFPVFALYHLQSGFCVSDCDKDGKAAFAETLRKLSHLTWSQIIAAGRHKLGTEKINSSAIKPGIPQHLAGVTFLALRYHGFLPMVGFREGVTFYPIWLERQFNTVYDHG